jgi:hypothetical protein
MWNSLARVLKLAALMGSLAASFVATLQSAQAQAPAPFGLWQGQRSGDYILINNDGSCSASGTVNVAGRCEWLATSVGGVLNMYYPMPLQPGRVGWSVTWIDRNTLMLNGVERFVRRR